MPTVTVILAAGLAVAFGAMVQSGAGLGVGLIGSPLVTLPDPALMPGSMLIAGTVLPVLILANTATSIGGPPVALLYAGGTGPQVRASLSAFLVAGNGLAVAALAVAGHLPGRDVAMGGILAVFAAAGFAAAARLRRFLDGERIRAAVLLLISVSAIALIARGLLG